jgi:hypothetical protein
MAPFERIESLKKWVPEEKSPRMAAVMMLFILKNRITHWGTCRNSYEGYTRTNSIPEGNMKLRMKIFLELHCGNTGGSYVSPNTMM